jgi:hypothetical protein
MLRITLFLFILLVSFNYGQDVSSISINHGEKEHLTQVYNSQGAIYISLSGLADALELEHSVNISLKKLFVEFPGYVISATSNNPYLQITDKVSNESKTIQLPTSVQYIKNDFFIPLTTAVDLVRNLSTKEIVIISPTKLVIREKFSKEKNQCWLVRLYADDIGEILKVQMSDRVKYEIRRAEENKLFILLKYSMLLPETNQEVLDNNLVKEIDVLSDSRDILLKIELKSESVFYEVLNSKNRNELLLRFYQREESDWYVKESEHFKLIYRETHSHLANHIISCAENSLKRLIPIFDYEPSEKIIINTYDASDYGFGATTNVPQNYIRLEIEAFEPGYEAILYNERIQWLLSHELVHIVVNDQESGIESIIRDVFGKVPPEKLQPSTIFYSVLGNNTRYTPRWYQEGIAVFIETWFSGGYGRTLGNFDEMYFRSYVLEGKEFPTTSDVETILGHKSIFIENIFYYYGTRFVSFLAINHGLRKVIDWFKTYSDQNLTSYIGKFESVFGYDFDNAWESFINEEIYFQRQNIEVLQLSELTKYKRLSKENFGWITQPYYDSETLSVIYGYHKVGNLSTLQKFHLLTRNSEDITSLPTPSMYQVASTAYDVSNNLFFYTTNNNKLYRDVWVIDMLTREDKILFRDSRIGNLSVSPITHDLWGVQQYGGLSTLAFSPYPYREITPIYTFDFGFELSHLSIANSGETLAGILHRPNGQQSLIIMDIVDLISDGPFNFRILTSEGSPENPSWSFDDSKIYWNAYTNGVSNLYSYNFSDSSISALTHCLTGLFKPIEVSKDSLFAFEFSTKGFIPVMVPNKTAKYLPAINYYGQKIVDRNPEVYDWILPEASRVVDQAGFNKEIGYYSLGNLHMYSFVPVISGFQNQIVAGIFTQIADPLLLHDLKLEVGVSPFKDNPSYPLWHLKLRYDYKQRFYIEYNYNNPDFFDLFNNRKRGTIGTVVKAGHTHYWLYDQPQTIKQDLFLSLYTGIEFINDNLVQVPSPDFIVTGYSLLSSSLRRTIGSSDYEYGNEASLTMNFYINKFDDPVFLPTVYIDYDRYALWLTNHNVIHLKLSAGILRDNENLLQGRFYFGGFGNRNVDNDKIRQYRSTFRFPGIPIYSMMTTKFFKLMLENAFPPIRVSGWELFSQCINHFDFAVYSQSLITESALGKYWVNIGGQFDIKFKHWYNLESTLSAGIAKAWSEEITDWQWFLSLKLLKD